MADTLKSCATCAYYLPASTVATAPAIAAQTGECRAEPPVVNYRWPRVGCAEWCGRWATIEQAVAREENKLKRSRIARLDAAPPLQVLGSTDNLPLSAPISAHAHATP